MNDSSDSIEVPKECTVFQKVRDYDDVQFGFVKTFCNSRGPFKLVDGGFTANHRPDTITSFKG